MAIGLTMADKIQFLLNDQMINLTDIDPNTTVLQYLREYQLKTGTKEGCGSGDCGACTVVIAELIPNKNTLSYKSINACITLVGSLHGKQLITVEHLNKSKCAGKPQLHPVQKHMVDNHASQCGFCTPGIVMSCYALHKNNQTPNRKEVLEALAGNLCRCTGYRSIIDAAMQSTADIESDVTSDATIIENQAIIKQLVGIDSNPSLDFQSDDKTFYAPKNVQELSDYLLDNPASTLVCGGTDLALNITQNLAEIDRLVYLGNVAELNELVEEPKSINIGAAVTYDKFEGVLGSAYPELGKMIERIGSTQVRNTGTLGGNVGNASPIGDMPPALIALGARMTLQLGSKMREIAVEDYFTGYKQTLLNQSEFIKSFKIPKPSPNQLLKVYKISKRFDDDISAVLVACFLQLEEHQVISVRIAFGGMAAIPKRAKNCEAALMGKVFNQQNIDRAKQALEIDFSPMSDVRASAEYRIKVAQNVIQRFYLEITDNAGHQRVVDYA